MEELKNEIIYMINKVKNEKVILMVYSILQSRLEKEK